jgi:hypothetical protein
MLASELATELGIEQSLMAKRMQLYYSETGEARPRSHSSQAVNQVRQAHQLLTDGTARTYRTALEMVLGKHVEPLPPASVVRIEQRLAQLETVQHETLDKVNRILRHVEDTLARRTRTPE